MKKLIALTLAAAMLISCAAVAFAATVEPQHGLVTEQPDEDLGEEIDMRFDLPTAFETEGSMTFTEYAMDEYTRADLDSLKEGDTILSFGEEVTVKTIEKTDDAYIINGGFENDDGMTLKVSEEDNDVFYNVTYNDEVARTAGETKTLPLADTVNVLTYKMEEDGSYNGAMDEHELAAGEVAQFLQENSMDAKEDGFSTYGDCAVYVKDGKITEIHINWSPNC